MSFNTIGDIAQSLMLRRQGSFLRTELNSLTQELSSGITQDLPAQLRGNFTSISGVEHSLTLQDGFELNRKMLEPFIDVAQLSLGTVQRTVDGFGANLLASIDSADPVRIEALVSQGSDMLSDIVSLVNTSQAGRFIFAGDSFDRPPISGADQIVTELTAAVSGATDAADFTAAVDSYFAAPAGGYFTSIYQGGDPVTQAVDVSSAYSISYEVTAQDEAIVNVIRESAIIALVDQGMFSNNQAARDEILQNTGSALLQTNQELISVQADLGRSQERIADAVVQLDLERQMFEEIRNEIITVDLFEVATELEAVQTQLESLYLITARTSRLSLSEYL
ncbi:MAG: flagellin [Litoreibacter sp.]